MLRVESNHRRAVAAMRKMPFDGLADFRCHRSIDVIGDLRPYVFAIECHCHQLFGSASP